MFCNVISAIPHRLQSGRRSRLFSAIALHSGCWRSLIEVNFHWYTTITCAWVVHELFETDVNVRRPLLPEVTGFPPRGQPHMMMMRGGPPQSGESPAKSHLLSCSCACNYCLWWWLRLIQNSEFLTTVCLLPWADIERLGKYFWFGDKLQLLSGQVIVLKWECFFR